MRILLDAEYVSIKGRKCGVIFRVAYMVYDEVLQQVIETYDIWCNYNLFQLFPNTSLWDKQLSWLNKTPKYNAGYVIKPVFKGGRDIQEARHILYTLVGRYRCKRLYCKGPTPTDALLTKLPLINIEAPLYEGVHEPLDELLYYNKFIE